jgi:hypothetical protein
MFCRPFKLCLLSCVTETIQVTAGRMRTAVRMLASSFLYHSSLQSRLTSSSCVILLSLRPEFYLFPSHFPPTFLLIFFCLELFLLYYPLCCIYINFYYLTFALSSPDVFIHFHINFMRAIYNYIKLRESIRRNVIRR